MGKQLVPKSVAREYKRLTQQLVLDLSQPLIIVQESPNFVDCPNCIFDAIHQNSTNLFDASFIAPLNIFVGTDQARTITPIPFSSGRCPICMGEGQLFTSKEVCIPAMINFIGSNSSGSIFEDLPAGKEGTNFALVKTLACNYDLVERNNIFVIHNNIKCEKFRPPFVRGMGGVEAVTEFVLQTVEAGQLSSGKFDSGDLPYSAREEDPRRRIKGPTDLNILRGIQRGQGG